LPVARADLEKTIAEALDGHLCRCTGYIKYYEAVRAQAMSFFSSGPCLRPGVNNADVLGRNSS
jgi:xanthine dehydrogenase iron-sulfur cluster and FAD-binding subunit A